MERKEPRLTKARHFVQIEIGAERGIEGREKSYVITCGIIPVAGSFLPCAVRRELGHSELDGFESCMQNLAGEFGFNIGEGKRAHPDATVANLVPIVAHPGPTGVVSIKGKCWFEPLLENGLAEECALIGGPSVVKPIIANGKSVRHLGGIQKMPWIPILEFGGGFQLLPGALYTFFAPFKPIK